MKIPPHTINIDAPTNVKVEANIVYREQTNHDKTMSLVGEIHTTVKVEYDKNALSEQIEEKIYKGITKNMPWKSDFFNKAKPIDSQ